MTPSLRQLPLLGRALGGERARRHIKNPQAVPGGHDVENKTVMHRLSRLRAVVNEAAGVGAWGQAFQVWGSGFSLGHRRWRC